MEKLANGEAMKILSPLVDQLFADATRQFGIADGHKLSKAVTELRNGLETYKNDGRKIIEKHGGKIEMTGVVTYPDVAAEIASAKEMTELNAVEIEFNFTKVKVKDDWPKLSLGETSCLEPVLDFGE